MRKNELIKLLQETPGNPHIMFWNGLVEDVQEVSNKIEQAELIKETVDFIYNCLVHQQMKDLNSWDPLPEEVLQQIRIQAINYHKEQQYELPNSFVKESEFERWYGKRTKKILILSAKRAGKTMLDRLGAIEY